MSPVTLLRSERRFGPCLPPRSTAHTPHPVHRTAPQPPNQQLGPGTKARLSGTALCDSPDKPREFETPQSRSWRGGITMRKPAAALAMGLLVSASGLGGAVPGVAAADSHAKVVIVVGATGTAP